MGTKREKIILSIITEVIQNVLNERLSDRVQDVSGLNHAYANKIVVAPILSVGTVDKDKVDLRKFEKEKVKIIRFIGLSKTIDGKSLGIAELPGGVRVYIDLVNLREVIPSVNENSISWKDHLIDKLAKFKDLATPEQVKVVSQFQKEGFKFSTFVEAEATDDKQSRVIMYKKAGKGKWEIAIKSDGKVFKQMVHSVR